MKNVVIACDYAYIEGGASKIAIETALALDRHTNYSVTFIAGNGEPSKELIDSNIKTICLRQYDLINNPSKLNACVKGIYNIKAYKLIKKTLMVLDPKETIVHIHTWTKVLTSAIFEACSELNIPIYLTVHDYFLQCPNGAFYNYVKNKTCYCSPMKRECWLCNCDSRSYLYKIWRCLRQQKQNSIINQINNIYFIFVSDFSRKQLEKNSSQFTKKTIIKNPIKAEHNVRVHVEENEYVGFIGRVSEEKGVRLFCQAVKQCCATAVVIGDGPLKEELEGEYSDIVFTGWLGKSDLEKWQRKLRCLVFPSVIYETEGLVVPECQAMGIPCIVNENSAASDNIIDNVTGLLFKPDVTSIAEALQKIDDVEVIKKMSIETFRRFEIDRLSYKVYAETLEKAYLDKL